MAVSVEDVLRIFRRHAAQTARSELGAQRRLLGVYDQATRELLGRLQQMVLLGGRDTFTALHYQNALAQMISGGTAMQERLYGELRAGAARIGDLSLRHAAERLSRMSDHFEGVARGFSAAPVQALADDVLLYHFEASAQRYGRDLVGAMQQDMAVSLATRESFQGTIDRLTARLGGQRYRAEVIARTEHAFAYNRVHHRQLEEENAAGADYQKSVVVVHDARTDEDSLGLERWLAGRGGGIPLDELFMDGAGRRYLHPPGRPMDREVEVPWRGRWGRDGSGLAFAVSR